jgi:hypothetical protein
MVRENIFTPLETIFKDNFSLEKDMEGVFMYENQVIFQMKIIRRKNRIRMG